MSRDAQHSENELIAAALIGDEAEKFFATDLGRTMTGMAEQELEEARTKLEDVDPNDVKAVTALQQDAKRARSFKGWISELIHNGRNAASLYAAVQEQKKEQ